MSNSAFDPDAAPTRAEGARADRTRWFGTWLIVVGLELVPSGLAVPWESGERAIVTGVTLVFLVLAALVARTRSVVPRWSIVTAALVGWLVVSVLLASVAGDVAMGVGLALGAVASLAFIAPGVYFLQRRA